MKTQTFPVARLIVRDMGTCCWKRWAIYYQSPMAGSTTFNAVHHSVPLNFCWFLFCLIFNPVKSCHKSMFLVFTFSTYSWSVFECLSCASLCHHGYCCPSHSQTKRSHALTVCRCLGSLTFHYGFMGMIPSVVFAMDNAIAPVELALPQNNPCKVDGCFE